MPVRRASVAVVRVDEIPNGEIRDLDHEIRDIDSTEIRDLVSLEKEEESRIESPAYMTDHCYARPVEEKTKEFESQFANDHGYSRFVEYIIYYQLILILKIKYHNNYLIFVKINIKQIIEYCNYNINN